MTVLLKARFLSSWTRKLSKKEKRGYSWMKVTLAITLGLIRSFLENQYIRTFVPLPAAPLASLSTACRRNDESLRSKPTSLSNTILFMIKFLDFKPQDEQVMLKVHLI